MTVIPEAPTARLTHLDLEIDFEVLQGLWTPEQYLRLTNATNRLFEFTDGVIEVLPTPTDYHQVVSRFLFLTFFAFIQPLGGTVLYSPLRLQIREGKFREPDLLLVRDARDPRRQNAYWLGADLVVEIVSPDHLQRDTEQKPLDYAEAHIPEYWIVNPQTATITVLTLVDHAYTTHGLYRRGETATSLLLPGLTIGVDAVFEAR
jgi:Uma2 family endonuclease